MRSLTVPLNSPRLFGFVVILTLARVLIAPAMAGLEGGKKDGSSSVAPSQADGTSSTVGSDHTPPQEKAAVGTRVIRFSGLEWIVKYSAAPVGPGPNIFSDAAESVFVDEKGRLHLKIRSDGGRWTCAEVVSRRSFGHGTYRFTVASPPSAVDLNAALGLFTWNDDPAYANREIDVEISTWGHVEEPANAQFVVQPYTRPGNMHRFALEPNLTGVVHQFRWDTNGVDFITSPARGAAVAEGPEPHSWEYRAPDVPSPGGENVRINLWLVKGKEPQTGKEVEAVIEGFSFAPEDQRVEEQDKM